MHSFSYTYPEVHKNFCLCDTEIDRIVCNDESVRFVFSNGLSIIENEQMKLTRFGYVEFCHGSQAEFNCHIIKREASPKGSVLYGYSLSLAELADMLENAGHRIELFQEFYNYNSMLWEGVLLPYNADGLSDYVVIETSNCYPMICFWD